MGKSWAIFKFFIIIIVIIVIIIIAYLNVGEIKKKFSSFLSLDSGWICVSTKIQPDFCWNSKKKKFIKCVVVCASSSSSSHHIKTTKKKQVVWNSNNNNKSKKKLKIFISINYLGKRERERIICFHFFHFYGTRIFVMNHQRRKKNSTKFFIHSFAQVKTNEYCKWKIPISLILTTTTTTTDSERVQ